MKNPPRQDVHRRESQAARLEVLSAAALTFLASDAERLDRFFAVTGLSVDSLRGAAAAPGFGESLLDYLAADERLYLAFAREAGYDPAEVEAFRMSLARPPHDF